MDSINFFKGYGKVSNQSSDYQNTLQRRKLLISISSILLLSLIIGLMIGALTYESETESTRSETLNSAESIIKTICNVTRNPNSCFSSITAINSSPVESDPEAILKLSLRVAIAELSKLSSSLKSINAGDSEAAIRDCRDQVDEALSRLGDSVSAMEVGRGERELTEAKIRDLQTWISAAMTDEETCLDGLEETGSTILDEVKIKMKKSKDFTGNALAIVANFHAILEKLRVDLH
ncbi:hypothetical protein UlMin_008224 [Ulmus minor]